MTQTRKISICLPGSLLQEMDRFVEQRNCNRSQFVSQAVQVYILEAKKAMLRESLKEGYQCMAELNLCLAENGSDDEVSENKMARVAEAE